MLLGVSLTPQTQRVKTCKHCLYFQVFCDGYLVFTSNSICIDVVKHKGASAITVEVYPSIVELGGAVEVSGSISPGVSAKVTLKIVSPEGRSIIREVSSTGVGYFVA